MSYSVDEILDGIKSILNKDNWDSKICTEDLKKIFSPSCFYLTVDQFTNLDIIENLVQFSKYFLAGIDGDFEDFKIKLKSYDSSYTCGFVWMVSDFGYRCRTCCLTPDMVLCVPCFTNGNHEGHDFNKIKCAVGGVCDCGNQDALREFGNCSIHAKAKLSKPKVPPENLVRRFKMLIPVYLRCLFLASWSFIETAHLDHAEAIQLLMSVINELLSCGWVTQNFIAAFMIDKVEFKGFIDDIKNSQNYEFYQEALLLETTFSFPEEKVGTQQLHHETFLEFVMFVCIKLHFNDNVVYFLNGMLPIDSYKEVYVLSYTRHYSRIAFDISNLRNATNYSQTEASAVISRISNISAQICSTEVMALKLVKEMHFHYLVVHCLLNQFKLSLTSCDANGHMRIDCSHSIITTFPWWTFMTDLHYLFSQKLVVDFCIADTEFMNDWITMLKWMQFMSPFGEEDSLTYCRSYFRDSITLEIKLSISPMTNIWLNYRAQDDKENVSTLVNLFVTTVAQYIENLKVFDPNIRLYQKRKPLSFYMPLIRNCACFFSLALNHHNLPLLTLFDAMSVPQRIKLLTEIVNILHGCEEALMGLWSHVSADVRSAAFEYRYNIFRYNFIDIDIFTAQICAAVIPSSEVMYTLTNSSLLCAIDFVYQGQLELGIYTEKINLAFEAWLMNICLILDMRNWMNADDKIRLRKEICMHLCFDSISRSDLEARLAKRKDAEADDSSSIDSILEKVANFIEPTFDFNSGHLQNGLFSLKSELIDTDYDPLFQSLRSTSKQESGKALSKYREYYRQKENVVRPNSLWPPYRIPSPLNCQLLQLENILHCKDLAYILFCSLYMFWNDSPLVTEDSLAIVIHLIRRSLLVDCSMDCANNSEQSDKIRFPNNPFKVNDMWTNIRFEVSIDSEVEKEIISEVSSDEIQGTPSIIQTESIISLLLKIHSKLYTVRLRTGGKSLPFMQRSKLLKPGAQTSNPLVYHYCSVSAQKSNEMGLGTKWGDGVDFIGNVLDFIVSKDDEVSNYLLNLIDDVKDRKVSNDRRGSTFERQISSSLMVRMNSADERKQKAEERRKKMLTNMAKQQKIFAAIHKIDSSDDILEQFDKPKCHETHQCVICQIESDPEKESMVSLGMLCNSASLSYMKDRYKNDSSNSVYRKDYQDKLALNIPVLSSGLIIQTCGHVVHFDCFDKYKAHKAGSTQLLQMLTCPLCRRPVHHLTRILTPEAVPLASKSPYSLLKYQLTKSLKSKYGDMETDIVDTETDRLRPEHQACSLLRAQLESELVTCLTCPNQYSVVAKRCQWPIFISYIRSLNCNILPLVQQSDNLLGISLTTDLSLKNLIKTVRCVPFLLESPSDMFLCLIPYVWSSEDELMNILNACIVMAYVKGLTMIGTMLNESDYTWWSNISADADDFQQQFSFILKSMNSAKCRPNTIKKKIRNKLETCKNIFSDFIKYRQQPLFMMLKVYERMYWDSSPNTVDPKTCDQPIVTVDTVAMDLVKCLIPLLRIATMVRLHMLTMSEIPLNFPITINDDMESPDYFKMFNQLCEFLNLRQQDSSSETCTEQLSDLLATCLKSTMYNTFSDVVKTFIDSDFMKAYADTNDKCNLQNTQLNILNIGNELYPPRLTDLPNNYDDLFNNCHSQNCMSNTNTLIHNSQDNALCLICGKLICLLCDKFIEHAIICCVRIGLFLEINTSIVFVNVNYKWSQWGSIYLDCYGEVDLELKRGRPLFLSDYRMKLLEQQWLTHSFEHVIKTWTRN